MKLVSQEFLKIANECGMTFDDAGNVQFSSDPIRSLHEFYESVCHTERHRVINILGGLIERERIAQPT